MGRSCGNWPLTICSRTTSKTRSDKVRTTMLMLESSGKRRACSLYLKAFPEAIRAINPDRVEPGGNCRSFDRRNDCRRVAQHGFGLDPPDEKAADIAFVYEAIPDRQPPRGGEMRQTGRRPRAARRAVDRLVAIEHGVAPVGAVRPRRVRPQNMAHPADRRVERVDRIILRTNGVANSPAQFHQPSRVERI